MSITLDDVLAEQARREIDRRAELRECVTSSLYSFCQYMVPTVYSEKRPYLEEICDLSQRVVEHKSGKKGGIVTTGPRFGKSITGSLLSAWTIGKWMTDSIMRASYGADLAETLSKQVMGFVQSDKYRLIFPDVRMKLDHQAVADWSVCGAVTSSYFCAGVGGPFTGKGASRLAMIDDQLKNIDDALNELKLDKDWLWYQSTFFTREEERDGVRCPELFIGTRWSNRDIIGRKMAESDPGDYEVFSLPAMVDGKSACEDVISTPTLIDMQTTMPSFIFDAEYMQTPVEREGLLYPVDNMQRFDAKQKREELAQATCAGYVDTADRGADSLGAVFCKSIGNLWYLTDVVFSSEDMDITKQQVVNCAARQHCVRLTVESNNGGRLYASNLREAFGKAGYPCTVADRQSTTNKETRILSWSTFVMQNIVFRDDYLPGTDYDRFMRELTHFLKAGRNAHDDAPDSITGFCESNGIGTRWAQLPNKPAGW